MSKVEPIRETISLCPVCRRRIPAVLVEDEGSVFMEKECPEHGSFRPRIAKYAHYYKDLMRLYDRLHQNFPYHRNEIESCAFTTTLRCNMKCPICFAGDEDRVMPPEITLSEIKKKLKPLRGRGINFKLTGGEPTTRKDLPEIIRLISESGNFPVMVTNASRLEDLDYLISLKRAGLYAVALWFDTTERDDIYGRMRGKPLIAQRRAVLENVRLAGLKLIIFFVCVRGVNEEQLPGVMEITRDYPDLFKIIVMGYMHRGSRGFSEENEYTVDELWEVIVDSSNLFSSLDDLFVALKVNLISRAVRHIYHCYNSQTVLMSRLNRKEDGFDLEYWDKVIKKFEDLLESNPSRAKLYFLRSFGIDLVKKGFFVPLARRYILRKKDMADIFIPPGNYWLQFQYLYYPHNYDEEMVRKFCPYPSFNAGLENHVSFCEYYNLLLHT